MPITAKDFLNTLPNGQTPDQENLYGFIPGNWLPEWVKDGYNRSIEGMAQQIIKGNPVFTLDRNYDPDMLQDIGATIVSFLTPTDFATMALGGGVGGVAIKKIAAKKMMQAQLKGELAEAAIEKGAQVAFSQARDRAVVGATGLGFYSGLQSSLGQKVSSGDVSLVSTLKDASIGATLGAATGGLGTKASQLAKARGYTPLRTKAIEKTTEVGVFGTAGPALEGELPSAESYIHAAGVIGGISLSRALKNKIINPPKKMLEGAELERAYSENAEAFAQSAAKERRGKETWINDEGREVKILTDWTRSRSGEDFFLLEDLKGKQFKESKENFFDKWYRFKDSKGNNAQNKLQKKTFYDLKKNLKLGDLEIKNMVDEVSGKEDGFKLKEHKDPGREYHTNYNKLSPKQRNMLYEKVQERMFVDNQKNEFRKNGIEIADMSGSSLLKESAPAIYNIIQGIKPLAARLPDIPIVNSIKKMIMDVDARTAELANKGMRGLLNATYITRDGKMIKGLNKLNAEQAIEFFEDMQSSDPSARARVAEYRKLTDEWYDVAGESGMKLAPKEKDYISKIPRKSFIRNVQKELEKFLDEPSRMLNAKLSNQTDVELHLKRAIENETGELSAGTMEAMIDIYKQQTGRQSYARAFQTIRDEVLTKYVSSNKNLEVARTENKLPDKFYENDARAILGNYVANWSKSVAMNEIAGADGSKVYNTIDAFQKKFKMHNEAELLRKAFDSYTGKIEIDPRYNWSPSSKKVLNDLVNFEVATKIGLGFATIPNLTQVFISSVLKHGYGTFIRGTYKMLTDKGYRNEIKENTGAGSLELHQIIVGLDPLGISRSSKIADKITTLSGFKHINRLNMLISSYTGYEAALKLQKTALNSKIKPRRNWAIRNLKDMGVTDISKKITPDSASRLMYEFSRDTQLQKNVFREPAFANDPRFRPFFLFKRFGYRQFQWIGSELKKEVKSGNVVFPLRLAAAGMAGGMFISAAKRMLSDFFAGKDVYDENYRVGEDQIGLNDILDNFAAVGAFGLASDIMASENVWQAIEFAAKPAMAQDAMKAYDALQKIVTDTKDFGLGFHVVQRSLRNLAPIAGTIPRRIAQQFETEGQRKSYVKYRYSKIHPRILDYMIDGNNRMAQRLIREWNNSFPERPITYDDIGPKPINNRLMNKYKKRMNP